MQGLGAALVEDLVGLVRAGEGVTVGDQREHVDVATGDHIHGGAMQPRGVPAGSHTRWHGADL